MNSPGKALAGAAKQLAQRQQAATLEPESSDALNHIGTKAREAPPWWNAYFCEDQEHARLDENQKTKILGKILAEDTHESPPERPMPRTPTTPRQDPCPAPGKTLAKDIRGAAARPRSAKTPTSFPCSCQPTN